MPFGSGYNIMEGPMARLQGNVGAASPSDRFVHCWKTLLTRVIMRSWFRSESLQPREVPSLTSQWSGRATRQAFSRTRVSMGCGPPLTAGVRPRVRPKKKQDALAETERTVVFQQWFRLGGDT
jgi:hypothetical protein